MSAVKIMLVDDELSFMEMMTKRLIRRGLSVLPALTGAEALEKLRTDPGIDVVMLETAMQDVDGINILKEIKRNFPLVEIIVVTGSADVESAIEALKLGAYDYVMKPCDMENLIAKIASAAAKKATHEEKILAARMRELAERGRG